MIWPWIRKSVHRAKSVDDVRALKDTITAALNAGKAPQVREICLTTINIIDRFEPGLEIHTADTLPSIVAARAEE